MSAEKDVKGLADGLEFMCSFYECDSDDTDTLEGAAALLRQQAETIGRHERENEFLRGLLSEQGLSHSLELLDEIRHLTRQLREAVEERDRLKEMLRPWYTDDELSAALTNRSNDDE